MTQPRLYEQTWQVLKQTGRIKLEVIDLEAAGKVIRGLSKEKTADPSKPAFKRIKPTKEFVKGKLYLTLELVDVIKTRYTVEI